MKSFSSLLSALSPEQPVLIAGPTASGKSALALEIAAAQGGVIVNADAIQVFSDWRVLTARPSPEDEAAAPHALYGHIPGHEAYSVGHWLRDVAPLLAGPQRLIITGGTGLYFTALTKGLAEIPPIPKDIRALSSAHLEAGTWPDLLAELDATTLERLDQYNPMRVLRAWEVQRATGRGLAAWQDATPAPLLPASAAMKVVFDAPKDWLTPRIEQRFDIMLEQGALQEAHKNEPGWHPGLPSAKAIGAAELIAVHRKEMTLEAAREKACILTRQFAKRQRTWFRARMRDWHTLSPIG